MKTNTMFGFVIATITSIFLLSCNKDSEVATNDSDVVEIHESDVVEPCRRSEAMVDNITGDTTNIVSCENDGDMSVLISCSSNGAFGINIAFEDLINSPGEIVLATLRGNNEQPAYDLAVNVGVEGRSIVIYQFSGLERVFQSIESSDILYVRTRNYGGAQLDVEIPIGGLAEIMKSDECMARILVPSNVAVE